MKVRSPAEGRHGYGPYTNGCRCETCREAKRQRQAHLREPYRLRAQLRPNVVDGIAHGRSGYDNCYCRCDMCRAAKSASGRIYHRRRDDPASSLTDAVAPTSPG